MPYVHREDGEITGLYAEPEFGVADEYLPEDHPEVQAFWARFDRIRRISARAFMWRIDRAKRLAIRTAARTNAAVDDWLALTAAGPIELDNPATIEGIDYLISEGLLTAADKTILLVDGASDELP